MTRKKNRTGEINWKEVIEQDQDFLKALVTEVVRQVLEAEMEAALGAPGPERAALVHLPRDRDGVRTLAVEPHPSGERGFAPQPLLAATPNRLFFTPRYARRCYGSPVAFSGRRSGWSGDWCVRPGTARPPSARSGPADP